MSHRSSTFAAVVLAFGFALFAAPIASATPIPGDDNLDGIVMEDESGWDCTVHGNRICGPNNSNDVVAGCYNDGGSLVAEWPCHIEVNADGSADVYTGLVDTNGEPIECRDICRGA